MLSEPASLRATDAALIEQSWADPERFETIFQRYFGQIHRYLAARVGMKIADDLAAEVFTVAFAQRQRYDLARDCARPWLYGIATNLAGTHRRQEQRRYRALMRADAQAVAPSDEDLVTERVSAAAAWPALATALAGLNRGERDVLLLVAVAGLDTAQPGPASSAAVLAKVPRYFVAISTLPGRDVLFGATATGAVLGTVAPPKPYQDFTMEAAAGDGRTFVLGASPILPKGAGDDQPRPVKFYRMVVGTSGRLGSLAPLPIPPQTGVSGLALSPGGSKLAVSWEADGRTLTFEVTTQSSAGWPATLYLLNTAAPAGNLRTASTRVPLPAGEIGLVHDRSQYISGVPLITGDGGKLIAAYYRQEPAPRPFGFAIAEFSVHTGKLIRFLYQKRTRTEAGATAVYWVNSSGTAAIAARGPRFGVQTLGAFTPLPPRTVHLFTSRGKYGLSLTRLPAW